MTSDSPTALTWTNQDQFKMLMEFIASLQVSGEEQAELARAAREFIEKRRPR